MRNSLLILIPLLAACTSGTPAAAPAPESVETEIQEAVRRAFAAYSFDGGAIPDIEEVLVHFTDDARMMYVDDDSLISLPARQYFEDWFESVRQDDVRMVREWETLGRTEWFGRIAHRISAYAFHVNETTGEPGRGVMSVRLVNLGDGWLVQSMLWENVSAERPLPPRFRER